MQQSIAFPLVVGSDLYPMEHLGGVYSSNANFRPGDVVALDHTAVIRADKIRDTGFHAYECWRVFLSNGVSFTILDMSYAESVRHISGSGMLPHDAIKARGSDVYDAKVAHLDISKGWDGKVIGVKDLEQVLGSCCSGDALIVDADSYTDRFLRQSRGIIASSGYNLKSPYFSPDAILAIRSAGVVLLAGNFPSFSDPRGSTNDEMLKLFWQSDGNLILAPLLDLRDAPRDVKLKLNPMRISAPCCGLPCSPVIYWD